MDQSNRSDGVTTLNDEEIPGSLNVAIMAFAIVGVSYMLWQASHTESLWVMIICALAFSFLNNTLFSLMHEAVHGHFHRNGIVEQTCGRLISGFFPTAFSLQRAFHLTHHRNNRSELERFDYYAEGENRLIKFLQWYGILSGLYWLMSPIFCALYFFTAELVKWRRLFGSSGAWFAEQTSAQEFLDCLGSVSISKARFDIAVSFLIQVGLVMILDLNLAGWAVCYAAFAVNWSSLQYTDHAFSDLDKYEGAWNLTVPSPVRWLFLNYHHHLVHHRDPSIPWTALPKYVHAEDPSPSFWSIYSKMWRGPKPLPPVEAVNRPNRAP